VIFRSNMNWLLLSRLSDRRDRDLKLNKWGSPRGASTN